MQCNTTEDLRPPLLTCQLLLTNPAAASAVANPPAHITRTAIFEPAQIFSRGFV